MKSEKVIVPADGYWKEYWYIPKCKVEDLPIEVKVGDMLIETIKADAIVSVVNARKITEIESDGTIRIECINKCPKVQCTYLFLTDTELPKLYIDNTVKESGRISAGGFLR